MALNLPNFLGAAPNSDIYDTFLGKEKNRYSNAKLGVEAEFARPNAMQDLMTKELDNIFKRITNETAGEKNRTDIEHTKAQTGLTRANTGLVGEQTKYYGSKAIADIGHTNEQTREKHLENQQAEAMWPIFQAALQAAQQPAQSQPNFSGMPGAMGEVAPVAPNAQKNNGDALQALMNNPYTAAILEKKFGIQSPINHMTPKQKELASLYGYGTPKYQEMLEREHGILRGADVPQGAVPLELMSPGERNEVTKDMRKEQKYAQGQVKVSKIANQMKQILASHPNMADDFAAAIVGDKKDQNTVLNKLRRKGANKKDLAAFEKFSKLSNDLVLHQGEATGKNFTDAKADIIQKAKPNATNTDEANNYLIDRILHDTEPAKAYNEALKHAFKNRYAIPLDMEDYRGKEVAHEEENLASEMAVSPSNFNPGSKPGTVKMYKGGEEYDIPHHLIENALKDKFTNGR